MKVIFLDIDGVLNSDRSVVAKVGPDEFSSQAKTLFEIARQDCEDRPPYFILHSLQTVDPVAVGLINKLLLERDVFLVLSSSHRKYLFNSRVPYGSAKHLNRLRKYLSALGLEASERFDITPDLHKPRGAEIAQMLRKMEFEVGIDSYLIIDDFDELESWQTSFVHVDPNQGFSLKNYDQAIEYLKLSQRGSILV